MTNTHGCGLFWGFQHSTSFNTLKPDNGPTWPEAKLSCMVQNTHRGWGTKTEITSILWKPSSCKSGPYWIHRGSSARILRAIKFSHPNRCIPHEPDLNSSSLGRKMRCVAIKIPPLPFFQWCHAREAQPDHLRGSYQSISSWGTQGSAHELIRSIWYAMTSDMTN